MPRPKTYLQNEQGKTFAFLTARRLTPDVQKLIWADVTTNYYRRLGDRLDPAFYARALQAAVRRLLALVNTGGKSGAITGNSNSSVWKRQIEFSMLAANRSVWKHRFDNLHERRMKYRVATSPKWHWGLVGQYEQPG